MSQKIVVSVDPYEARAALLEGDRLINVEIENAAVGKRKGNIYKGRVSKIEDSIEAAFIDYGVGKDGFLPFDEVSDRSLAELTGHPRASNNSGLSEGDWVLVQVTKEEIGKKGASLTMHISLPGRFVVLTPFSNRIGVSRKLVNEERTRLKQIASQLVFPDGFGCIMRTVGKNEQITDIQADLEGLLRAWEDVLEGFKSAKEAQEIHSESGLAVRFVRDYMTSEVTDIFVEGEGSFNELKRYVASKVPGNLVKHYEDDLPLFVRHGVERQIEALLNSRVQLPSGGSIVIGQTEALVAIDVNSGRQKSKDIEDTAYKANLEAAREIARQCVLRDLGGIIVVDFIDMDNEGHRRSVEDELRRAFALDKARLTFTRIQEFGLLCFSRQRLRQAVDSAITLPCPACSGAGRVRSPALLATSALRKVRERLAIAATPAAYVEISVPVEVANFLNNRRRDDLLGLENRHDVIIDVIGYPDMLSDEIRIAVLPEVPTEKVAKKIAEPVASEQPTPSKAIQPVMTKTVTPVAASRPAHDEIRLGPLAKLRSLVKESFNKVLGFDDLEEYSRPLEVAGLATVPVVEPKPVATPEVKPPKAARRQKEPQTTKQASDKRDKAPQVAQPKQENEGVNIDSGAENGSHDESQREGVSKSAKRRDRRRRAIARANEERGQGQGQEQERGQGQGQGQAQGRAQERGQKQAQEQGQEQAQEQVRKQAQGQEQGQEDVPGGELVVGDAKKPQTGQEKVKAAAKKVTKKATSDVVAKQRGSARTKEAAEDKALRKPARKTATRSSAKKQPGEKPDDKVVDPNKQDKTSKGDVDA